MEKLAQSISDNLKCEWASSLKSQITVTYKEKSDRESRTKRRAESRGRFFFLIKFSCISLYDFFRKVGIPTFLKIDYPFGFLSWNSFFTENANVHGHRIRRRLETDRDVHVRNGAVPALLEGEEKRSRKNRGGSSRALLQAIHHRKISQISRQKTEVSFRQKGKDFSCNDFGIEETFSSARIQLSVDSEIQSRILEHSETSRNHSRFRQCWTFIIFIEIFTTLN